MIKPFFKTKEGKKIIGKVVSGAETILVDLDAIAKWQYHIAEILIVDALRGALKDFETALKDKAHFTNPSVDLSRLEIGFYGECIPYVKVHEIGSKHIGKLVKVKGLVNRTHFLKPMAKEIVFKCRQCSELNSPVLQESPFDLSKPPSDCELCGEKTKYDIVEALSKYIDSQEFSIQESHEDISSRIPQRIRMITYKKYLINKAYCGDVVEIVGVVKLLPEYRRRTKSRFNQPYIEVYYVSKKSKDPETMEITTDEEKEIIALSKEPNIYSRLINSVAPSICENEGPKEAGLLSLFGGVAKDRGDIRVRGSIHVLFVGDPSTAKSQLLKAFSDLSPRGMMATGRGTTAAGLTAAMNKDELTGEWVIDAGVLVLSDNGVACIDEIEKMRKEDRINLHEAMAQQVVTINKAGRHTTLKARTAIIAAANPTIGKYKRDKSVFENLSNFPPALFSRFDLIFTFIDRPEIERDLKIARHIMNPSKEPSDLDRQLFKKYIAYAKRINPILTDEAGEKIRRYFSSMRGTMKKNWVEETTPITFRQLEGLVRLCEARARALLKKEVDVEDVECIKKLFGKFLKGINFDFGGLEGKPKNKQERMKFVKGIIRANQGNDWNTGVAYSEIVELAHQQGLSKKEARKAIAELVNTNEINEAGYDGKDKLYRTVGL